MCTIKWPTLSIRFDKVLYQEKGLGKGKTSDSFRYDRIHTIPSLLYGRLIVPDVSQDEQFQKCI